MDSYNINSIPQPVNKNWQDWVSVFILYNSGASIPQSVNPTFVDWFIAFKNNNQGFTNIQPVEEYSTTINQLKLETGL